MVENCLIIAGEKSGEEHTLTFFHDLKRNCPNTKFYGVGGDVLSQNGMELLYHLNEFSSMGFSEVVGKIPFYFNAQRKILNEVKIRKSNKITFNHNFNYEYFNSKWLQTYKRHQHW